MILSQAMFKAAPFRHRPSNRARLLILTLSLFISAPAFAGGGPEGVLVVASADSGDSLAIAKRYIELRDIPATNLLALPGIPASEVITVDEFRAKILQPIVDHLKARDLIETIDTIAYSIEIPFGIDFKSDLGARVPDQITGQLGSLTGMTYLYERVLARDVSYLDLSINHYYREPLRRAPSATDEDRERLNKAMKAITDGDHQSAAVAYDEFLASYPEHAPSWYNLACCRALLGQTETAIDALQESVERGWNDAEHVGKDTDLDSLRAEPRFIELVARMKAASVVSAPLDGRAFLAGHSWLENAAAPAVKAGAEPATATTTKTAPLPPPERYLLSVMLGYTGPRGNTKDEVTSCMERAAKCDASQPRGAVYFLINADVRATTRQPGFARAAAALEAIGRKAFVLETGKEDQDGVLPQGKKDVFGAMIGSAGFDWAASKSRMIPGAICEHLTSFGAAFQIEGQTKLSELIRHGAAGASGTVTEPLALAAKFPSPLIHLYYAQGCSLAESFMQSVAGPYQLLIVGDPLARPCARFAKVEIVTNASSPRSWSGVVEVRAKIKPAPDTTIARIEAFIDGVLVGHATADEAIAIDTAQITPGKHELRVVAIESGDVATRSYAKQKFEIGKAREQ